MPSRVMASASVDDAASPTLRTITISYSELNDRSLDLSAKIRDGFGPDGLGILSVSNVPRFPELRQHLLDLTSKLANLPEDTKQKLEDPDSRYNFGWSHGKERVENGKLDTMKGSFYANPILDVPTNDSSLLKRYPAYCRPNIWPTTSLPALEAAFKALGKLMFDVGLLLAYHCDQYVSRTAAVTDGDLMGKLKRSRCHKGRLLYYFPKQESDSEDFHDLSSWCGWHTDHGSLTGLTCGMFTRNGVKVSCPDGNAGLYIQARNNQIVKVVFAEDEIAYQIGETTEVLSGGNLCATPHCVKAPGGNYSLGVERSTFALFMQPDWDETLYFPGETRLHSEIIPQNRRLTFGEYSERLLNKYYNKMQ